MVARAFFDTLRSLAFGSISGSYAAIGDTLSYPARLVLLTNNTDGDMIFSDDSSVAAGKVFVAANSFVLLDVQANINPQFDDRYVVASGTQFYVKQSSAPSQGSVYIAVLY